MAYFNNSVPTIPISEQLSKGTVIKGFVRDSGNQVISTGWIEFTSDGFIVDGSSVAKTLVIPKPRRFPLTGTELNIELVNSQYSETTYRIRIGETDTNLVDTIYADFHAQIPYGQIVDVSSLAPTTITRESLPSTTYRIAELILDTPELRSKLLQVFTFRGHWSANTIYSPYDLVFVPGTPNRTFICIETHDSGSTFNPSANWQQLI